MHTKNFIMSKKVIPFEKSFASHPKSAFWSDKNIKTPAEITLGSGLKAIFICSCGKEFSCQCSDVSRGLSWCPCCALIKSCRDVNCERCFEKSVASKLTDTITWSNKNEKPAINFGRFVHVPCYFHCGICNHHFKTAPSHITDGQGCPYCSNTSLCEDDNCEHCFKRSFASNPRSEFWSDKNKLSPRQVFKNSETKFFFECKECNHTFKISLSKINLQKSWCNFCSSKYLCEDLECNTCFLKSFASSEMSKYLSKKNPVDPRTIMKGSEKKYIFDCPHCNNEYTTNPKHIMRGQWCTCKRHKTEALLYNYLLKTYTTTPIQKQPGFSWCMKVKKLPFDFCMIDLKIIIEVDGDQHFRQIWCWNPLKDTQDNDTYKMQCAIKNGYSIIRIYQPDIWGNKNDWKIKLDNAITKFTNIKKPSHIFIGDIYTTQYPTLTY